MFAGGGPERLRALREGFDNAADGPDAGIQCYRKTVDFIGSTCKSCGKSILLGPFRLSFKEPGCEASMCGFRLIVLRRLAALALFVAVWPAAAPLLAQGATATQPAAPPRLTPAQELQSIQAASEKDHQRMMDLLGIKALRPGDEKDANWDLTKADQYPNLPDPLVEKSGKRVTTAAEWWKVRRPEIVEDYDREVLGRTPPDLPRV